MRRTSCSGIACLNNHQHRHQHRLRSTTSSSRIRKDTSSVAPSVAPNATSKLAPSTISCNLPYLVNDSNNFGPEVDRKQLLLPVDRTPNPATSLRQPVERTPRIPLFNPKSPQWNPESRSASPRPIRLNVRILSYSPRTSSSRLHISRSSFVQPSLSESCRLDLEGLLLIV